MPPDGDCRGGLLPKYHRLCDTSVAWGIVLETVAAVGAVTSVAFMLALLALICKVQDSNKRKVLPVQFLFLVGVLGVFGLTFAFIIQLDGYTGPTRFFLFGVLFSLCFSCLLAHAFNLCKPQFMKQSYGVENRAYTQEEITQGLEELGDTTYVPYTTHFQLQNRNSQKDFSIPRAQTRVSPYNDYEGRKNGS